VFPSHRFTFARFAARGALAAALAASLALAGCGRKPSGLDAPPLAAAGDMQNAAPPAAPAQRIGPDGKPVPPPPPPESRKTFLDWLID
jgi:hypothetical protein